jgi:hypothetical protein
MMTRLLAEIKAMQEKTDANIENFEVLRDNLVSQMNAHQARTESTQEEIKANEEMKK